MTDQDLEMPADAPGGGGQPGAGAATAASEQREGEKDLGPLKEVLEALVFVHRGILQPKTVREVLGEEFTVEEIEAGFAALVEDYQRRGGAVVLLEVAGGYQFGTRLDLAPWIQKLDFYEHHRHLSRPSLETLAIIAYKQPVTRAEIEAIRGVNVERIVRNLIERKLVRILGHKDVPGKPMVLGTTREFLELFGLNSLAGLPPLKDFVEPPSPEGIYEEPPPPAEGAHETTGLVEAGEALPADAGDPRYGGDEHEPERHGAEEQQPKADDGESALDPGVEPPQGG